MNLRKFFRRRKFLLNFVDFTKDDCKAIPASHAKGLLEESFKRNGCELTEPIRCQDCEYVAWKKDNIKEAVRAVPKMYNHRFFLNGVMRDPHQGKNCNHIADWYKNWLRYFLPAIAVASVSGYGNGNGHAFLAAVTYEGDILYINARIKNYPKIRMVYF